MTIIESRLIVALLTGLYDIVPAVKIAQFLAAGCSVTILVADIHAFLDNLDGFRALI